MKLERTAYETAPVENITEAVHALASAYNRLQDALHEDPAEWEAFGAALRMAIYKPIDMPDGPPISLYEVGVTHTPEGPERDNKQPGLLGVHEEKLNDALENRADEMKFFFAHDEEGLLARLCFMLEDFRNEAQPPPEQETDEQWQMIYPTFQRFLNECRRLAAFWGEF